MSISDSSQYCTEIEQSYTWPHPTNTEYSEGGELNGVRTLVSLRPARSLWTYLKWVFGTIISGLFRCRTHLLASPVDDQWPAIHITSNENTTGTCLDSELRNQPEVSHDQTLIPLSVQDFSAKPSFETNSSLDSLHDKCELSDTSTSDIIIEQSEHLKGRFLESSTSDSILTDCDDVSSHTLHNGLYPDDEHWSSPTFTLLTSLYEDSKNGLIDTVVVEHTVNEILQSVIPRNLSHCTELTSSTPCTMYSWNASHINDNPNTNSNKQIDSLSLRSDLSTSNEELAYPGKLTMSDDSSSPISSLTGESSTPTGDVPPTLISATENSEIRDTDFQDHTSACDISHLKTNVTAPERCAVSNRPPIPNFLDRKSRDKSPVSTVNSFRLPDASSMPSFTVTEGHSSHEKSPAFHHNQYAVPKPKRSSSLKSHRTPPETPEPKSVRFADALGLDLETVRHVFDQEIPPKIPASATFDLEIDTDESIAKLGAKQFGLCFAQPGMASNFVRRVLNQTVCLEDAHVNSPRGVLTGTIRVRSLGFEKRIFVRITYNNWATYCDTPASYIQGSHDGVTDRFAFSVVFPDTMVPGDRAQFAVRYEAHTGEHFWDNNHGQNYSIACYAKATDLAGDGSWVHYL